MMNYINTINKLENSRINSYPNLHDTFSELYTNQVLANEISSNRKKIDNMLSELKLVCKNNNID